MIYGCIGRGGGGKSYTTVRRLWRLYNAGRDIVSNTPLVDLRVFYDAKLLMWRPRDPELFGESWACHYIKTFDEIDELDECEVFLDELRSWMPRSSEKEMSDDMRQFVAQDRREGVQIHWTHRTDDVWKDIRVNTAEIRQNVRYGPVIVQQCWDPQSIKDKWRAFDFVSPQIYDLYQTFARVGNGKTGTGYGLGKRKGYRSGGATGELIVVRNWTEHLLDIKVRPNQFECLIRKFGPDALGIYREEDERRGLARWIYPGRNHRENFVPPPPSFSPFDAEYHQRHRKEDEI